ncbi:MAG: DNA primase [Clostridia bacterium]|nr:DNA primase [Clostridia bacterium]
MRYSDEILDEVKSSNDIVDVISQYISLKRSGRNYFGLCPFHNEKSPSFSVSPDKQIFHCFGCGVGGNVISFISKIEGIGFKEAIEVLAEKANIKLPTIDNSADSKKEELKAKVYKVNSFTAEYYHKKLYEPSSKIAQEYVKKRQLNNETLQSFKIGFSGKFDELYQALKKEGFNDEEILESGLVNKNENGKYIDRYRNRLMIPILDERNRVIAFGGRVLDDSKPKYINSPENIVYSKGRHLFGLNVAKKGDTKRLLIVEGYMDAISLHQRGITSVVASLGTALTTSQGWLLRKNCEQVILGFDSDGAGQTAILRAMEVMQNMGCDMRVLQMSGAKDPDEYVLKYGAVRFQKLLDDAISLIEFKIKILQKDLNLENASDKIKFLNEIAKLISKIENTMEREIYIEKIAKGYNISKEAIYAEVNKLQYSNRRSSNILEKERPVVSRVKKEENISEEITKRENTILWILINSVDTYKTIKENIQIEDFKNEENKEILKQIYNALEKGNDNISSVLDHIESDQIQSHLTEIMAEDYGITDNKKAIDDLLKKYELEKLETKRDRLIDELSQEENAEKKKNIGKELNDIVLILSKINQVGYKKFE